MSAKLKILVVEDNPLSREVMAKKLEGHSVTFAEDIVTARRMLKDGTPDLCFIDLQLGVNDECSGLDLIPLAVSKGVYSVVMSSHDSEKVVERAYELGCNDFYAKGNQAANVDRVLAKFRARRSQRDSLFEDRFVTQDPNTRATVSDALRYATSDLPVLILGPSGVGKTSLAQVIHDMSGRSGEFVAINCSAYTEDLLEAELFGYRKGAFTGASENRKGKLLLADGGTLFLDEIGSMSLQMQTKLLKAIEERSFYPLNSEKTETSNFRIISATLEDLHGLIRTGKLRFDFYQRIQGLTIKLPSLAERKGDVLPLIAHFTAGGKRLSFSTEAKERLLRHDWPGNTRELKKFVELLVDGHEGRVTPEAVDRLLTSAGVEAGGSDFATGGQYDFSLRHGLSAAIDRITDQIIARNLAAHGGKKSMVLKDLKISTRLLYQSLKRSTGPMSQSRGAVDDRPERASS